MDETEQLPPPRPPRTPLVHLLVDSAVAFLLLLVVGLLMGATLRVIIVSALVVGIVAAPFTYRAEVRALTARERRRAGGSTPSDHDDDA